MKTVLCPAVITIKKGQIGENSTRFKKTKRNNGKKKGTNAKHRKTNLEKFQKNSRRTSGRNLDFQIRSRLHIWPTTTLKAMDLGIFAVTGGNFTGYFRFLKAFMG